MWLCFFAPKSFLGRYSLKLGALVVGIVMCVQMVICFLASLIHSLNIHKCICPELTSRISLGYGVTSVVYCFAMFICQLWFIWGSRKGKVSVVLGWMVITTMWLVQAFCLMIVLIIAYSTETSIVIWILCLIFGLIGFGINVYCILLGLGYWLELRQAASSETI